MLFSLSLLFVFHFWCATAIEAMPDAPFDTGIIKRRPISAVLSETINDLMPKTRLPGSMAKTTHLNQNMARELMKEAMRRLYKQQHDEDPSLPLEDFLVDFIFQMQDEVEKRCPACPVPDYSPLQQMEASVVRAELKDIKAHPEKFCRGVNTKLDPHKEKQVHPIEAFKLHPFLFSDEALQVGDGAKIEKPNSDVISWLDDVMKTKNIKPKYVHLKGSSEFVRRGLDTLFPVNEVETMKRTHGENHRSLKDMIREDGVDLDYLERKYGTQAIDVQGNLLNHYVPY
ncbi:unnamed protein product [Bursaphelenchus xylophilus]|uniref:(pine wood nematode) hypothetical protein n=1 Tax=Bursaphelenchus xylophilus TaxID=6326 RepID=A0A1I7SDW8_BURXY|nr:unnamed protein product [Bursaphelenchus xylophilus]CAG9100334.1 unnamed protein product [Bursaphelenchus xylophilus]